MQEFAKEFIEFYPTLMFIWFLACLIGLPMSYGAYKTAWPNGDGFLLGGLLGMIFTGMLFTGISVLFGNYKI